MSIFVYVFLCVFVLISVSMTGVAIFTGDVFFAELAALSWLVTVLYVLHTRLLESWYVARLDRKNIESNLCYIVKKKDKNVI